MAAATAFATPDDLAARWRALTPTEEARAAALLDDASTMIRTLARGIDEKIATNPLLEDAARLVACSMVRRGMSNPNIDPALNQFASTIGPMTESASYGERSLFINRQEREMLGIRKRIGVIDTLGKWTQPESE